MIVLAGALHPSPLQRGLGELPVCLPMGPAGTLLDAWLATVAADGACREVRIVVNNEDDARSVEAGLPRGRHAARVAVTAEPAAWRGSAGLVADVSRDVSAEHAVVVVEAHCYPPPPSLSPLLEAIESGRGAAAVAAGPGLEPAGLYALAPEAVALVPPVGYHDLKEQLLPALARAGREVRLVALDEPVLRIRDRAEYLEAVRRSLSNGAAHSTLRRAPAARVSPEARLAGCCIIEAGAVVEAGALVHDSVILEGAVVGPGAVVSRSVVARHAEVGASERLVDRIMTRRRPGRPGAGAAAEG